MLIYKYTSSYAGRLIIENSSVRFSQIDVLNDPFELSPSYDLLKNSLKEFIRSVFKKNDEFRHKTYIEKESFIQQESQYFIENIKKIVKNFLVFSLAKKEENLLMWSHYADSHRGMVIGFNSEHPFFHQIGKSGISIPYDVQYTNKRPTFFNYFKIRRRDELPQEEIRKLFLTKSTWWEYEEEVRMFSHPEVATDIKSIKDGFDIYLFDFPKECLKKIIFGSLMNPDEKKAISKIAKNIYPHAELFQVVPSETDFALKFKPYKIL